MNVFLESTASITEKEAPWSGKSIFHRASTEVAYCCLPTLAAIRFIIDLHSASLLANAYGLTSTATCMIQNIR